MWKFSKWLMNRAQRDGIMSHTFGDTESRVVLIFFCLGYGLGGRNLKNMNMEDSGRLC
jgi:hypothetical protein